MKRVILTAAAVAGLAAAPAQAATTHDFKLKVLSSPASMVTGGDALVPVTVPRTVPLQEASVSVNGTDVTATLELDGAARTLTGMVTGLRLGDNTLQSAGAEQALYDPAAIAAIKWTHWDDLVNVYGVDAFGYGRSTFDNVGVQYGLAALKAGRITPAEFLKLNAMVGSWKESKDMVQEGCPFLSFLCADPAQFDPWSAGT